MATGGVSGLALSPARYCRTIARRYFRRWERACSCSARTWGRLPDEREHLEQAGHGERNGANGGRWGKDGRIAHGDEDEGVI